MIADNDYNVVKPVENLQNVGGLTPIDRRDEKRRRQAGQERKGSKTAQQDSQAGDEQDATDRPGKSGQDDNCIDYRA